ncbi:MAG: hypothetical protein ABW156_02045 [Jiangellaceae bacterium]
MNRSSGHRRIAAFGFAGALTGVLVAGGPLPAGAAVPDDTTPPQVQGVSFSRESVAVSGLSLIPVRVSVRLTDPSGVVPARPGLHPAPGLTLGPVPGFQSLLRPALTRTSGTATDGVWSATVNVPSTWHGSVRVTSIDAVDAAGNVRSGALTGAPSPVLRVNGTHRPVLTFDYALLPGGGFRVHGQASYADTGQPLAHTALATAYDSNCDLDGGATNDIVTDRRGRYEKSWPGGDVAAAGCVALIGRAAPDQRPTVIAYRVASRPLTIPDTALLQPADLGGATPGPLTDDTWSGLRRPQPCPGVALPSAAFVQDQRAVSAMIGFGERPTVIMEHVATYRADGADRYLAELRRDLASCGDTGWTVLATGVAGDESMLLRLREYVDYAQTWKNTYVLVARVGSALVVLADTGWEAGNGHESLVRDLSAAAVSRAAVVSRA